VTRLRLFTFVLCLAWPALLAGQVIAPKPAPARGGGGFRVCADPENMPFSNKALQGFESRIADVLAKDFGTTPSYVWWGQRQGFIRNTMNATLESGRCDIVMGVPVGYDLVRPTQAYYRSSYVFVYPRGKYKLSSLDDPILKRLKIGVHLLGNDYENPPPVHELGKRHIVDNRAATSRRARRCRWTWCRFRRAPAASPWPSTSRWGFARATTRSSRACSRGSPRIAPTSIAS
jgi:hypothetical protein